MKRLAVFSLVLLVSGVVKAQQFKRLPLINLGDSITIVQAEWVAVDRDSLLDIVMLGATTSGELQLTTFRNEGGDSLVRMNSSLIGLQHGRFELTNWDVGNLVDLLVSGRTTSGSDSTWFLKNIGDFVFEKQATAIVGFGPIVRVANLNATSTENLIVAGEMNPGSCSIRVFERNASQDTIHFDSTGLRISDIALFDANEDGFLDFAVSGEVNAAPVTFMYVNKGDYRFSLTSLPNPVHGDLAVIDQDNNGTLDLVGAGLNESGSWTAIAWQMQSDAFTTLRSFPAPPSPRLFVADMNSDGLPDWVLNGGSSSFILDSAKRIPLDSTGLILQSMGDMDRDGDLDIFQAVDSAGVRWIRLLINSSPPNKTPDPPSMGIAVTFANRTFITWQKGQDDHTPSGSVTHDVWLGSSQEMLINPISPLAFGRRMLVAHGNAGTSNGIMIRGLTDDRYYYDIQSIDNAYNGSYLNLTGSVLACFDISRIEVQACANENVTLTAGSNSYWFTSAGHFLGQTPSLTFIAAASDTVFSVQPQGSSCAQNKIWVINVHPAAPNYFEEVYACRDSTIRLGIPPGWNNIVWDPMPVVQGMDTTEYVVNENATIIATGTTPSGCQFRKEFRLHMNDPEVNVSAERYRIVRGHSVRLDASGPVGNYVWTPTTGLSNPAVSDPVASPVQTTTYSVSFTDSIGCTAEASVLVQVEDVAFVPNLFTPNGDGANDALLIYGLTTASTFRFRIFNREGNTVYETDDVSLATAVGWNGSADGTLQPSGLYYWKVEGYAPTGTELTLNGKKTGSILLLR